MAMLAQGENTQDASARGPEHCLVADPENIMSISRGLFPKKYAFNKTFPRHPANIPLAADHPGAQCDHQIPLANAPVARPGSRSENRCWEKKMLMTFAGLTNAWLFQAQPSAHPCRKSQTTHAADAIWVHEGLHNPAQTMGKKSDNPCSCLSLSEHTLANQKKLFQSCLLNGDVGPKNVQLANMLLASLAKSKHNRAHHASCMGIFAR